MDKLSTIPTAIGQSVMPTMKAYDPLLRANADAIRSTKCETFTYGNHERQSLDIYYPSQRRRPSISSSSNPVLIFVYGGGLVNGAKKLPVADGLAYANLGHFFAEKLGYTTIIPDYRLMSHGARFPSGGEDIAQVVEWVRETLRQKDGYQNIDLFIVGNSAGGVHLSTYLLAPDFASRRAKVMTADPEADVHLRGVVLLSVPFNMRQAEPSRAQINKDYFGDDIESRTPQGLLKAAMLQDPDNVLPYVKVMLLNGSLDPKDEIMDPRDEFLAEWENLDPESRETLTVEMMEGQNHISPPLALGTGIEKEEAHGFQIGAFIDSLRS